MKRLKTKAYRFQTKSQEAEEKDKAMQDGYYTMGDKRCIIFDGKRWKLISLIQTFGREDVKKFMDTNHFHLRTTEKAKWDLLTQVKEHYS